MDQTITQATEKSTSSFMNFWNALSSQSQVVLVVAIPVILFSQWKNFHFGNLISNILLFAMIAFNANCLAGKGSATACNIWSWFVIAMPVLLSISYTLYFIFYSPPAGATEIIL